MNIKLIDSLRSCVFYLDFFCSEIKNPTFAARVTLVQYRSVFALNDGSGSEEFLNNAVLLGALHRPVILEIT